MFRALPWSGSRRSAKWGAAALGLARVHEAGTAAELRLAGATAVDEQRLG